MQQLTSKEVFNQLNNVFPQIAKAFAVELNLHDDLIIKYGNTQFVLSSKDKYLLQRAYKTVVISNWTDKMDFCFDILNDRIYIDFLVKKRLKTTDAEPKSYTNAYGKTVII